MHVIFFGSATFSIPVLAELLSSPYSVVQVVTTPDRKKGRGLERQASVVKIFAQEKNLPVLTPQKLSDVKVLAHIQSLKPEFIVIAAYGKIVPPSIFKTPTVAALNVHPSLLPKYRGASPIQQAILDGNTETGVSIAEVTAELDAGDLFGQAKTKLDPHENAQELSERLAALAAPLLLEVMDQFRFHKEKRVPQDGSKSSYAKKIEKRFGEIDWNQSAVAIHNHIRAYVPWPSAFTFLNGKRLKILRATHLPEMTSRGRPGEITDIQPEIGIHVRAASGIVVLKRVQLEGRQEMNASEFSLGQRLSRGDRLPSP